MRLTLRTMLAYLDGNLEPDDTEDIGKKIEESEFATNLVHRTRDCMRRLRLGVPALLGRGLAADPNTVAEYLEYELADDRVPEFEKICLESDVHLAEVASCHQILTLVLREPAEINPQARQRMYRVAGQTDAPPVQPLAAKAASAGMASTRPTPPPMIPNGTRRAKPEVPDYLRESPSRFWPVAAMLMVAAMLTFGGLMLFVGPTQLRQQFVALIHPPDQQTEADANDQEGASQEAAALPAQAPSDDEPLGNRSEDSASVDSQPQGVIPSEEGERVPTPGDNIDSSEENHDLSPTRPAEEMPENPESENATDSVLDSKKTNVLREDQPLNPLRASPARDRNDAPSEEPQADGAVPRREASEEPASPRGAAKQGDAETTSFGRYMSKDVLLKFDPKSGKWFRLPSMSPLAQGDRFLSLPSFRPTITLSSSISIQADGGTLFELIGWNEQGAPILSVEYGRLLIATVGKSGNSLQLKLDERESLLTFVDADSTMALEVHRELPPGRDPQAEPAPLVIDVYATSGLIRIREGESPVELPAPSHRILFAASAEQPSDGEFPKWITSETLSDVDRLATTALEPLLQPEKSVTLTLKELVDVQRGDGRKREVRSLAIRSLNYLGDFEASVSALNDSKEKLSWFAILDEMQLALARNPQVAGQVRAAFEKQRSGDAEALYRMLWGYSVDNLKAGSDKDLVDGLDHASLDYRVMSIWNLQNIMNRATYGYQPTDPVAKRRTNPWKEKLRQGKILPRTASASSKGKTSGSKGGS